MPSTVTIPANVTSIGDYAFQNDTSITTITMSDLVTFIGEGAFSGCTSLSKITLSKNLQNPFSIQSGSTTWRQYWGIPNSTRVIYTVICFKEDSKILCLIEDLETYVKIQDIRKGTFVKTYLHGYLPVDMIGHSKIYNPGHNINSKARLYKCSTENYPELTDDLIITGCHSILVDELTPEQTEKTIEFMGDIYTTDDKIRLIAAIDERATPYKEEGLHNIWHLALENKNYYTNYGIYANGGLLVETTSRRMMKEISGMELI